MKGIIGKKIGMTQIFDKEGRVIPVTVLKTGPCTVIQIKTEEKDGYRGIVLGFEDVKEKSLNKPLKGKFTKLNLPLKKYLREFRDENIENYKIGDEIGVDIFKVGDKVSVIGFTKGKGFTGVVKRWGFKGGPKSHGSMIHRKPMSIGDTNPNRVIKGKKMPGHLGNERVKVKNLEIVKINKENNLILVKGAVPGAKGRVLRIIKT